MISMKQFSLCVKQSEAILGVDQAWQNNGSIRLTIPKPTIGAGRRHTVGIKSGGTVIAVGDNKYGQCNDWSAHKIFDNLEALCSSNLTRIKETK